MTRAGKRILLQGSWWLRLIRLASRFAAGPEDACERHNKAADQAELDRLPSQHDRQRSRRPADTHNSG
jgi:hypothetical protein